MIEVLVATAVAADNGTAISPGGKIAIASAIIAMIVSIGGLGVNYLAHLRSNRQDQLATAARDAAAVEANELRERQIRLEERADFQKQMEELHAIYRSLVEDLRAETERLQRLVGELHEANTILREANHQLSLENSRLSDQVTRMSERISALEAALAAADH